MIFVYISKCQVKNNFKIWAFVQLKTFGHEKIVYTPQECMIFTPTNLQFFWGVNSFSHTVEITKGYLGTSIIHFSVTFQQNGNRTQNKRN
jgi:hypothetical protein